MNLFTRLCHWLGTPLRAAVSLTDAQIKSLYSVAMLAGIVALSAGAAVLLTFAYGAATANHEWFKLAVEILRYMMGLIGLFALAQALIVFGADYFDFKWGDKEARGGRGPYGRGDNGK